MNIFLKLPVLQWTIMTKNNSNENSEIREHFFKMSKCNDYMWQLEILSSFQKCEDTDVWYRCFAVVHAGSGILRKVDHRAKMKKNE